MDDNSLANSIFSRDWFSWGSGHIAILAMPIRIANLPTKINVVSHKVKAMVNCFKWCSLTIISHNNSISITEFKKHNSQSRERVANGLSIKMFTMFPNECLILTCTMQIFCI